MNKKSIKMQQTDNETLTTVSRNIDYLMFKKGIDGAQLSTITGLAIATVNGLRRGTGNPTLATLVTISQFFNVSLSDLTETDLEKQTIRPNKAKKIPLIRLSEINDFLNATLREYETYTTEIDTPGEKSFFAVLIHNDSLYPHFSSGTVCVISQDDAPCDGDIVLVKINNHTPCFRKIFIEDKHFLFTSLTLENDTPPTSYSNSTIIGILLKSIKNFA